MRPTAGWHRWATIPRRQARSRITEASAHRLLRRRAFVDHHGRLREKWDTFHDATIMTRQARHPERWIDSLT
jgi:hypothetical protein